MLYVSFPSLKDPALAARADAKHTAEVVTFVRYADFEALKHDMERVLLRQLLARLPKLAPLFDFVELSTPLSTEHFVRPAQGSIYGLEPTPTRFANRALRPRSM